MPRAAAGSFWAMHKSPSFIVIFLVNRGKATSADLENLGEEVRRRVYETSGVKLEWEIERIGKN